MRKVDIYSFAIIMWEILTGSFPFQSVESQYQFSYAFEAAIANGLRPALPIDLPNDGLLYIYIFFFAFKLVFL